MTKGYEQLKLSVKTMINKAKADGFTDMQINEALIEVTCMEKTDTVQSSNNFVSDTGVPNFKQVNI